MNDLFDSQHRAAFFQKSQNEARFFKFKLPYQPRQVKEMARRHDVISKCAENFDAHHPDGEKSQIFSRLTAQADYAPNLII